MSNQHMPDIPSPRPDQVGPRLLQIVSMLADFGDRLEIVAPGPYPDDVWRVSFLTTKGRRVGTSAETLDEALRALLDRFEKLGNQS